MRAAFACLCLAAACSSTPGGEKAPPASGTARVRVQVRQFYAGSIPVVVENLAGREVGAARKTLRKSDPPVAFVPDDVMARLLKEMRRIGFEDFAGPAAPESALAGARGEIRVAGEDGRVTGLVRRAGQGAKASQVYTDCVAAVMAVYNFYQPARVQAGEGDFGVRKAGQ